MKVSLIEVMKDLKGEPLKVSGADEKELTLKDVILSSLCYIEKAGMTPEESVKRYKLISQVMAAEKDVDLSTEEASLLKKLIAMTYGSPLVAGQACMIIEGMLK